MKSTSVTLRIPDELLVLIDAEAEAHGMTRTAAIVNFMWGLAPLSPRKAKAKSKAKRFDPGDPPFGVGYHASPAQSAESLAKLAVVLRPSATRPPHDPKTCRVYKCGMCPPKEKAK